MSKYEHGRVLSVDEVKSGSELVADHAAGVSSLTVVDAADFDEDGGWLSINDQVIEYTAADDDTGTLTLNGTLTALADEGDRVYLWNPKREAISSELIAEVAVDGEGDNVDPIEATVALHLVPQLPEGIRGSDGESVLLELDGDEWRVVDVLGIAANSVGSGGLRFEADDSYAINGDDIAAAVVTVPLSHVPIEESMKAFWNSVFQPPTAYTIDYTGGTVTFQLGGFEKAGDTLWVHYAYMVDVSPPPSTDISPPFSDEQLAAATIIPFTNTVSATATGAGNGHGQTSISPAEGPVWAPGNGGAAIVGAYYSDDYNFYGVTSAFVDYTPSLPAVSSDIDVHIIAMLKVTTPAFLEHKPPDSDEWAAGSTGASPRVSMRRNGTNATAYSSGAEFEWEGWKMIPVDTGDLAEVYQGIRSSLGRSILSVKAASRSKPIGTERYAAQYVVDEVALMIIPAGV